MFIRFDTTHEHDRQTDTHTHGIGRAICIASRGKKIRLQSETGIKLVHVIVGNRQRIQ